jgi:hypothetical protein
MRFMGNENAVDTLIHEPLAAINTGIFAQFSAESDALIAAHARTCPRCQVRYDELLATQLQGLGSEKRASVMAAARLLAADICDESAEKRYLAEAFRSAEAQQRPELIREAQERVNRRRDLVAAFREAV